MSKERLNSLAIMATEYILQDWDSKDILLEKIEERKCLMHFLIISNFCLFVK